MNFKKLFLNQNILLFLLMFTALTTYSHAVNFSILKNDKNVAVTYGNDLSYDFEYSNWEHRLIENVVFEDTIPNGTTFEIVEPWECDGHSIGDTVEAGTICKYLYGDVAVGNINVVLDNIITVKINDTFEYDQITNTVKVLENGTDEIATSTVVTPVRDPEVYSLVKSEEEHFFCTDEIELGIFVDNVGLVHVKDLSLELVIPENIEMLNSDWSCQDNICNLDYGNLSADTEVEFLFTVKVIDQSLCEDGPVTFDLNLTSVNKYEDAAYRTIYLEKLQSDLEIRKSRSDLVTIEEDEEYRATIKIEIENTGEVDLTEIYLDENLDEQLGLFDGYDFVKAWSDDCKLNSKFNGDNEIRLVENTDLKIGESCTLYYEVLLRDDEDEEYDVLSSAGAKDGVEDLETDVNLKFELEFDNDDALIQAAMEDKKSNNSNNTSSSDDEESTVVNNTSSSASSSYSGGGRVLGARSDTALANTGVNLGYIYLLSTILLSSTLIIFIRGSKI